LIAALIALAAVAAQARRLLLTAALLGIGLFAHEASLIFGLPLAVAIFVERSQVRPLRSFEGVLAAVLLLCCVALYASLSHLPHAEVRQVVDTVRARLGIHAASDFAVLTNVRGERGFRDAMCQNSLYPNFFINALAGLVMIACCIYSLAGGTARLWMTCLIAALPPFIFLWIIALDDARWITLSLVNVWLVCALSKQEEGKHGERYGYSRSVCAAVLVLLNSPLLCQTEVSLYSTSPVVNRVISGLRHAYTLGTLTALRYCDPDWEAALSDVQH
jgi:hypothetical protein